MKDEPPRRLGRDVLLGGLLALAAGGALRAGLEAVRRAEEVHEAALNTARAAGRRDGGRERAARALARASRVEVERSLGSPYRRLDRVFLCAELREAWSVLREAARSEADDADAELADLDARFELAYARARRDVSSDRVRDALWHYLPRLRATLEEPDLVAALGDWLRSWATWAGRAPSCSPGVETDDPRELRNLLPEHRHALRALRGARGDRPRVRSAFVAAALVEAEVRSMGHARVADQLGAEAAVELSRAAHLLATQPRREPVGE